MKLFTALVQDLSHTSDEVKTIELLTDYFTSAQNPVCRDQALNFLLGHLPKRIINSRQLKRLAPDITGFPGWLVERSENEVGNFVQTLHLLLRPKYPVQGTISLTEWMKELQKYRNAPEKAIQDLIKEKISGSPEDQRLMLLKLLTGTFKSPVSKKVTVNSLAKTLGITPEISCLRLYHCELNRQISFENLSRKIESEELLVPTEFPDSIPVHTADSCNLTDKKWEYFGKKEGIEAQLIKRGDSVYLWTRDGEIISDKVPEIVGSTLHIRSNLTLYGQVIPKNKDAPLELLYSRLNKKSITKKDPEDFVAQFEIWESFNEDHQKINRIFANHPNVRPVELHSYTSKEALIDFHNKCRVRGFSGVILKPRNKSVYHRWKANSLAANLILMYVEFGRVDHTGIRSMTFGAYLQNELLPVAKVSEIDSELDAGEIFNFVKENTLERFGPVRTVKPFRVYKIEFDGLSKSSRRKSGLVLACPKIHKKIGDDPRLAHSIRFLTGLLSRRK